MATQSLPTIATQAPPSDSRLVIVWCLEGREIRTDGEWGALEYGVSWLLEF
jgi:hypothetical protein